MIRKELYAAAESGINCVFIDDGWFSTFMGEIDETKFPNKFHQLAEIAGQYGIELGLWCNPLGLDIRHPRMALWDGAECHDTMLEPNPWNWLARTDDFHQTELQGGAGSERSYSPIELMDQEAFTNTFDEVSAKVSADTLGCFAFGVPYVVANSDISFDSTCAWFGGLTSEYNPVSTSVVNNYINTSSVRVLINADTEYPEALARLVDYFYTDEGAAVAIDGFEGIDWNYAKVDGISFDYEIRERVCPEGYSSSEEYRYKKAIANEAFNVYGVGKGYQYELMDKATDEDLDALRDSYGWLVLVEEAHRDVDQVVETFPPLVYTAEEAEERSTIYTDISSYLGTMRTRFITGELDIESEWDSHVETVKGMGLDRMLEIDQADNPYRAGDFPIQVAKRSEPSAVIEIA